MLDMTRQIQAVRRRVEARTLASGERRVVALAQTYDAPIEDVWQAVTSAERIPRWFLPVTGDLRAGGRYQLEGNAGGTIERCDPPHTFAASWEFGGAVSWIEVRLTAVDSGRTQIELEHVAPHDPERWATYGPGAVGVGWDLALPALALHLTGGETVDAARAAAWAASEAGRLFATDASNRWCEASIAFGTDPGEARAAAERTTAFYTAPPSGA
jgi:uncharacterized protein YndB with AHSA1/START domain